MKKKKLSQHAKKICVIALFGLVAMGGASSTLLFMHNGGDPIVNPGDENVNPSQPEEIDEIKNKLFENLTAADLDIDGLTIDVKNVDGKKGSINLAFTGGVNYLSFMKDQTNNGEVTDPLAKFGGKMDIKFSDDQKQKLNETLYLYTPGKGTIYLDWNDTGYSVSGTLLSNALSACEVFLTLEQQEALNGILEQIQAIDIISLLPMVGTVGGSLASAQETLADGNFRYKIEIPGSMLEGAINGDITLNLDVNAQGELVNLSLNEISIPVANQDPIIISMKTTKVRMHGINSEGSSNIDSYKEGLHASVTDDNLANYYKNNLDSTPNLAYTIAKMMNAKKYKLDYSLALEEYQYTPSGNPGVVGTVGNKVEASRHNFGGSIAADVTNGFNNGNYKFSIDSEFQGSATANSLDVQYQGVETETDAKGIFLTLNDTNKAYMDDATMNDLMTNVGALMGNTNVDSALGGANDILTDSVIGDIVAGDWFKYKSILNKLETFVDPEGNNVIRISVKAGGLNMNIPFEFENVLVNLDIRYKSNDDNVKNTLIKDIVISNIPLRKVSRVEGDVTNSYLDTASMVIAIDEAMFNDNENFVNGLTVVKKAELVNYVEFKAVNPLLKDIAKVVNTKQFNSNYSITYTSSSDPKYFPINVKGNITADLTKANFDATQELQDKNYGTYELTATSVVNDILHNVQLNYQPDSISHDQNLYFTYHSQNPNYLTRLSLQTETMSSMFDVISNMISSNTPQGAANSEQVNQDIFGTLTSTLEGYIDFVNGDIWNLLNTKLPEDKLQIYNPGGNKELLAVKIDTSLFGSKFADGFVTVALSKNAVKQEFAAIDLSVKIPGTSDMLDVTFSFDDYDVNFKGLEDVSKYKATDSSVNAIMNILTNDYLNSFVAGGVVTSKKTSPRN